MLITRIRILLLLYLAAVCMIGFGGALLLD